MARWNDFVARGIVGLVFTLAPEAIVLGTIAVAAGDLAFGPIREQVKARVWGVHGDALRIVPAALGKQLPYLAALGVALQGLRDRGV
jgi:glucokinase